MSHTVISPSRPCTTRSDTAAATSPAPPGLPPTQTLVGVAALTLPDMLFEVDAVAVTGDTT